MKIRRALPEDSSTLTDISFKSKKYWEYPDKYFQIWKEELTITNSYITDNFVYVFEKNSSIIAYYSIINLAEQIKIQNIYLEKGYWLEHMFVLPEYIGQNIGRQMFYHLLKTCKRQIIQEISVLSDPNSKQFYLKMGFEYIRDIPSTIKNRTTPQLRLII
ncbi:GNAT family N-acetyltransferase [Desulfocastanea catecholica]